MFYILILSTLLITTFHHFLYLTFLPNLFLFSVFISVDLFKKNIFEGSICAIDCVLFPIFINKHAVKEKNISHEEALEEIYPIGNVLLTILFRRKKKHECVYSPSTQSGIFFTSKKVKHVFKKGSY